MRYIISIIIIISYSLSFGVASAMVLDVPYTSQAPLGQWGDPRQQDGCEEASILMAMMWAKGTQMSPEEARQEIIGMSNFEQYFYGYYQDTSAQDTANLMVQYYSYSQIDVQHNISVENIKTALNDGFLVIVPLNPRIISTTLYNKNSTRHMVVVVGYDDTNNEIIFNDPLIGPYRRAPESVFQQALADYASGRHIITKNRTSSMIIVARSKP